MLRRRRLSSTTVKKKSKHVSNDSSDFWADQVLILSKASNKTLLSLTAPVLSAQRWELQKTESSNSSSVLLWSREITRTIRDAEPRTATSTFTQLLSSAGDGVRILSLLGTVPPGSDSLKQQNDPQC